MNSKSTRKTTHRPADVWPLRWWEWLLLIAGLATFFLQVYLSAPQKSAIFDEQYHLTAGYSYLRTGDFRMATNHPPLMGMIAGLPLLTLDDIVLPTDDQAWETGDRFRYSDLFLWESNDNAAQLLLNRARLPIMLVGLLLLIAIFAMSRQFFGAAGGWLVFVLAVFDPNLLAHSRFVTTDLGLTCFLFIAIWQLWRWLEQGSWYHLLGSGIFAGLAMAAKYTGLLFWPAALLIVLLYADRSSGSRELGRRLLGLVGVGLTALVMLWAIYGFDFGSAELPLRLPLPAPFYWQNLYNTYFRIVGLVGARLDFFMGEASAQGWPAYFPVALGVKTPLPTLLLSLSGLVILLVRGQWRRQVMLWALPLVFLVLALSGILTIGYRHMLPAIPFMLLWAGNTITWTQSLEGRKRTIGLITQALLVLWLAVGTVSFFPHYESFFNELAGPWTNWSNILVDSNLDWGQDLPALREVMDEKGIDRVNLAYFGKAVPEQYGVRYSPLPSYLRFVEGIELSAYNPHSPEPGWYAISATSLRLGLMQPESVDLYAFFRDLEPDARAGYSIYLYNVQYPDDVTVGRGQIIGQDVASIPAEAMEIDEGHRAMIKWTRSPDTTVYPLGEGFSPADTDSFQPTDANFDDVFKLIGYSLDPPSPHAETTMELTLYWEVGEKSMPMPAPTKGRPLSTFVHLVDAGTTDKVIQFDGWETAMRGLEPGDIIAQKTWLSLTEMQAGDYDVLVGLYSPQDWTRLPVISAEGVGDHFKLDTWKLEASPP